MAQGLIRGVQNAKSIQWTEAALTVAVSTSGNDSNASRPEKLVGGDWSSMPFATPQAALNAIPKGLDHDVIVQIGAGTFAGFVAHGFMGKGRLRIAGSKSLSSVTTGSNSGTAGSGTTTTSMNKPTAASNWTASDLRGKFLVITSGGGESGDSNFPTIRPIKSNTTTALEVDFIYGMDNTSVFQIVDVATILTVAADTPQSIQMRVGIVWCQAMVEATLLKVNETTGWYGALLWNSQSATLTGCHLAASSGFGAGAISCTEVFINSCLVAGEINPFVIDWLSMSATVITSAGRINAQHIGRGTFTVDASGCTGTAVKIQDSQMIALGANLNNCAVTPLDLQNVNNFQVDGYLTGTNATPTRGMTISRGGQYIITGATLAGSSSDQFTLEGRPGSYAELSGTNSGTYAARGSNLHWGASPLYTVYQTKLRVEGGEVGDQFDEFITNNMVVGGIVKHYGAWQFLNPAYKEITAHAGGGQANATVIGYKNTVVTTVASAGDSVRMLDEQIEISYAGGLVGTVANAGANAMDFFPPQNLPGGNRTFVLNGVTVIGFDTAVSIPAGHMVIWQTRNDLNTNIWLVANYADIGGGGDVSGPGSSTDNAIPRWDGTAGDTLQDSAVTIDDNGMLTVGVSTGSQGLAVTAYGGADGIYSYVLAGGGTAGRFQASSGWGLQAFTASGSYGVVGSGGTSAGIFGYGASGGNNHGVVGEGHGTGYGVRGYGNSGENAGGVQGSASGNGIGVDASASGTSPGLKATNTGSGYALSIHGDTTSPVKAAIHIDPQDAQPTGAHVIGDIYVGPTGIMYMCTSAGTPGTWTAFSAGSSVGDVVGPGSATDNALARFDSTTGKLIQNSGATLSDTNGLTLTASGTNEVGITTTGSGTATGLLGTGGATNGSGVKGVGGSSNGIGGEFTGAGTGAAIKGTQTASGYGLYLALDTSSPVAPAIHIDPQDAVPSGASVLGDLFVLTTSGILKICTTAGTPGTYESLIKGTVGATDNRLVRSDGTGTATVQGSGITVTDTDGVSWTSSGTNEIGLTVTGNGSGGGALFTGGSTNSANSYGVKGVAGHASAPGVQGSGTGAGTGVRGDGGSSAGAGVDGFGGASAGSGVRGTGGSSDGTGVTGTGGSTNGKGGQFNGTGTGAGVLAQGGSSGSNISAASGAGIYAIGGGTGPGGYFLGGSTTGGAYGVEATGTGSGSNASGGKFTGGTSGNGITAVGTGTSNSGINATGPIGGTFTATGTQGTGVIATGANAGKGGDFTGEGSGSGLRARGGSGNSIGVDATGFGTGAALQGTQAASGYGLKLVLDTTSPVAPAMHIDPQDADPSGAAVLGDLYVRTTSGIWKICTTAGTPGTYENLIKGTTGSTDNRLLRSDGTGTATIQASGITIDDADGISGHTEVQNVQSGTTYTMTAGDCGKVVIFTSASAVTVTVPQTLTAGWHCRWEQQGAGQVSFNGTAVTAATLNNRQAHTKAAGQYAVGGLACYTSGTPASVTLFGDTAA